MLSDDLVERILAALPQKTIGVLGDLFLDRYLDIDASLTEPSIETGLDAYQVLRVRSYPGAAGTVMNNLAAFGVGRIVPVAVVGDDGEGYELRQSLRRLPAVDAGGLLSRSDRRTPTYTKPMLQSGREPPRELNRLDIKNRLPTPPDAEREILEQLDRLWPTLDALVVLDQVSEPNCGVVTEAVRGHLESKAVRDPSLFVLADSRELIGSFRAVCLKPNRRECSRAASVGESDWAAAAAWLAGRAGRAVFATGAGEGILLVEPGRTTVQVGAYPVAGPVDPVGAGDSCSAGIVSAVAAGATLAEAAAFGNLIASITVQQIGVTGTASPEEVRQRWRDVREMISPVATGK